MHISCSCKSSNALIQSIISVLMVFIQLRHLNKVITSRVWIMHWLTLPILACNNQGMLPIFLYIVSSHKLICMTDCLVLWLHTTLWDTCEFKLSFNKGSFTASHQLFNNFIQIPTNILTLYNHSLIVRHVEYLLQTNLVFVLTWRPGSLPNYT